MLEHLSEALLYEAGELEGARRAGFERHLADCAECQEHMRLARRAHAWALDAQAEPAPELLAAALAPRVPARRRLFWLAGAGLAAAFAVLALVALPPRRREPVPAWDGRMQAELAKTRSELAGLRETLELMRSMHQGEKS